MTSGGAARRNSTFPPFRRAEINLQTIEERDDHVRTVPQLIEYNASHNPNHIFCVQVKKQGKSASQPFHTISHLQLKQAISSCSKWLVENVKELRLTRKADDGKVLKGLPMALFMESDVGLLIHKWSLMSLGVPVLLLSARLSPTAVHHLIGITNTVGIVASPRLLHIAKEAISLVAPVKVAPGLYPQIPYDHFLREDNDKESLRDHICAQDHYLAETDRNVLILHSSGTTGLPKPIYTSHKHLLCFTVCHSLSNDEEAQGLNLSTLPLYHGFGLVTPCLSLGIGKTFCLPAPSVVPTGLSIVELLKATNADALMSVPSILEEIALLPGDEGVLALTGLRFVAFGGGLLKPIVGEKLATAGVKLLNHYGTTETGPLAPIFIPTPDYDWRYFRLRKDMDLRLEPVIVSQDVEKHYKLIVRPFGWETTFEIQDKLVRSPNNPSSDFNAVGRNDDLLVLATGEKVIPHILENILSANELVKVAIAFGEGRFELGVIVQSKMPLSPDKYDHFKSLIWPTVLKAGDQMDTHARISSKDAIIITPPETVIPRTDKASVMRKEVFKKFETEIARAYEKLENNSIDDSPSLSLNGLEKDLKNLVQTRLNWNVPAEEWTVDDDFFEIGMNSLQAVQLRRFLLSSVQKSADLQSAMERIDRDFVYQFSSVASIASALRAFEEPSAFKRHDLVNHFVKLYSLEQRDSKDRPCGGSVVLLTGSTGSLGVHLLAHLARLSTVARVICLNRVNPNTDGVQDPRERQYQSAKAKGIGISQQTWSKIQVLESNAALPYLGLKDDDYAHLRVSVTHILHNAWPMDFKRKLRSFKAQFQTLQNLLHLAIDAHAVRPLIRPKILLVSSIAVVGQYGLVHGGRMVPETRMDDASCTNRIGYAEAKLVCETIMENAVREYSEQVEAAYVRVGQIVGSQSSGSWNTDEHLAALVKSSQRIGNLPNLDGTCSWIPVDRAANAVTDILLTTRSTETVYHLENPVRQSWHEVLSVLARNLDLHKAEFLPFDDWLDAVRTSTDDAAETNPARQLAEFFKTDFRHMACGNVILDTEKARKASAALRSIEVVSDETIAAYINDWRRIGFLK